MSLLRRIRQFFCGHHETYSEHALGKQSYWECNVCGLTRGEPL